MRILLVALAGAAFLTLAGCDELGDWGNSERFKEDFHYNYPVDSGATVSVENANGSIEIFGTDTASVDVSGTKYASNKDVLDAIKIEVSATPNSVHIRTVRPSDSHGSQGARYTIRVPRTVKLDTIASSNGAIHVEGIEGPARLQTTNGSIRVTQLKGNLDAHTSNGSIDLRDVSGNANLRTTNGAIRGEAANGSMEAHTSNGAIELRLSEVAPDWPVKASSTNGHIELAFTGGRIPDVRADTSNSSIRLRLPPDVNARVHATTSHASISSDFDVLTNGMRSKNELEGNLGTGGPLIDLSTSNGSISISKY